MATVIQTDRAWPDYGIERGIVEAAGHTYVAGPATAASAGKIEELVAAHEPAAIMTCWAEVSAAAIRRPNSLQIVQRIGVGLDNIDVAAASRRGAWVANVPDYCVGEVADHAIALLLDWARGIAAFDRQVKAGRWNPAAATLRRVAELTVGIVGLGPIGRATAARLQAFGCRVLANTRTMRSSDLAEVVPLDELLRQSQAVILHAPLTGATHHLIDAGRLAKLPDGALLINVSRGPLVDNGALLDALESGKLSGAGLDVIEGEPEPPRELVERPDVTVTPHVGFSSDASIDELRRRSAANVVRVLSGELPEFPCNEPARG